MEEKADNMQKKYQIKQRNIFRFLEKHCYEEVDVVIRPDFTGKRSYIKGKFAALQEQGLLITQDEQHILIPRGVFEQIIFKRNKNDK